MSDILSISWINLSFVSLFIVILFSISLFESLRMEKTIVIASLRSISQLILTGYFILFIFELDNPYIILFIFIIMCLIGANTIIKRVSSKGNYWFAFIALSISSLFSIFWVSYIIVDVSPWYTPRYIIPLAGMIVANCVNGVSLAGERYKSELTLRLSEVEMFLSLGYSARRSSATVRNKAINSALIPFLNNMILMGIVHLPGMMTGQIIAGVNPVIAVRYQIVIIFCIIGTTALASYIFLKLLDRKYFTHFHQIRYELL